MHAKMHAAAQLLRQAVSQQSGPCKSRVLIMRVLEAIDSANCAWSLIFDRLNTITRILMQIVRSGVAAITPFSRLLSNHPRMAPVIRIVQPQPQQVRRAKRKRTKGASVQPLCPLAAVAHRLPKM